MSQLSRYKEASLDFKSWTTLYTSFDITISSTLVKDPERLDRKIFLGHDNLYSVQEERTWVELLNCDCWPP